MSKENKIVSENPTSYEILAQEIYRGILESEGVDNIDVKHNVDIMGKSGVSHQIDVYWEFKQAGVKHCVLIECKHYTNSISLIHARNLKAITDDIPNSSGIIVTTNAYQSGVVKYCEFYGVHLKRIRPPMDQDWEGFIQIIDLKGELWTQNIKGLNIHFDDNDEKTVALVDIMGEKKAATSVAYGNVADTDLSFFDFIIQKIPQPLIEAQEPIMEEIIFPQSISVHCEDERVFSVKSAKLTFQPSKMNISLSFDAKDFVAAVLEDYKSKDIEYTLKKPQ